MGGLEALRDLFSQIRGMKHRGFVGPKYRGLLGKLRLLWQGRFHEEIVSCAESHWWKRPEDINPDVSLVVARSFEEVVPYLAQLREAYSRDFTEDWKTFFAWGQIVTLALLEGHLAGFGWIQEGDKRATTPYVPLLPGEFRLVRGGVLPEFRGKRVHTTRYVLVLEHLFANGGRRVYIDCFTDNVYSWKGQHRAGFREIGRIQVAKTLAGTTYVRWLPRGKPDVGG